MASCPNVSIIGSEDSFCVYNLKWSFLNSCSNGVFFFSFFSFLKAQFDIVSGKNGNRQYLFSTPQSQNIIFVFIHLGVKHFFKPMFA